MILSECNTLASVWLKAHQGFSRGRHHVISGPNTSLKAQALVLERHLAAEPGNASSATISVAEKIGF